MTELATRPPGRRPLLLKPEIHDRLIELVRDAVAIEIAAKAVGIAERAYYNWMRWGREELERRSDPDYAHDESRDCYVQFVQEIEQARAQALARNVGVIQRATEGGQVLERRTITKGQVTEVVEKYQAPQWTAAAWTLERSAPSLYGRREAHHLSTDPLPDRPVSEEERLAERVRAALAEHRVIEGELTSE